MKEIEAIRAALAAKPTPADPTLAQADQRALPLYTAPQPERKPHTEAEVQALLDAGQKLATMRYSDAEFEQYVRRVLGVPKP